VTSPPEPDSLPPEAEDALRDAIAEFGVLVAVCVDADGTPIEGRHRMRLAQELGLPYPTRIFEHMDTVGRVKLAARLNADRSRLAIDTRRDLVTHLTRLGHSGRAIARALRMGKHTVARDIHMTRDHHRAPDPVVTVTAPSAPSGSPSLATSRVTSALAEVTSTCASLDSGDVASLLTPAEARHWRTSVGRALAHLRSLNRSLQARMEEVDR
jgi:hypothetical protein